ncbi:conserved protein of unknown function (Chromosomal replication initiator, DnaA C-terminal 2-93) [Magnetospirillum sp. XM-1]|uniref:helix-turn-helix domain-containing protein n=1 Tax=Magnetospirillum sp. XM-1 TaxID=1663591 RepID=UPI00073DC3E4|nr:helix-turn-helix domain-containing protein [Magnetospirillum sp. XM-1]CUW41106.1 conserved protein of unknown function (Chromosomal replication initiator, DnaA C-terminal 2-93) [Magnetospirillum sp. XM-1]
MTPADIKRLVAAEFDVSLRMIEGESRSRNVVRARWAVMWVLRHGRGMSLGQIAAQLGGKDHTTVSHGLRAAEGWLERDSVAAGRVAALLEQVERAPVNLPADLASDAASRMVTVMVDELRHRLGRLARRDPQAFVTRALSLFAEGDAPCAP